MLLQACFRRIIEPRKVAGTRNCLVGLPLPVDLRDRPGRRSYRRSSRLLPAPAWEQAIL